MSKVVIVKVSLEQTPKRVKALAMYVTVFGEKYFSWYKQQGQSFKGMNMGAFVAGREGTRNSTGNEVERQ